MQVAVIDDGINEEIFEIGTLRHNIEIDITGQIRQRKDYNPYLLSHGTVCAAIIHKYAPSVILSSIKVLDEKEVSGNVVQLSAALRWCLKNHIDLVNLSLGSTYFKDFDVLKTVCNDLFKHHLCIVAAQDNNNLFTVPACLSSVLGVKCNLEYKEDQFEILSPVKEAIDSAASGCHSLMKKDGHIYITHKCNSYAAPLITAKSASLLLKHPKMNLLDLKQHLMDKRQPIAISKKLYDLSYLSEAYLINLSKKLLLKQLCFKVKEELGAEIQDSKINLVIVADKEVQISENQIKRLLDFLQQYQPFIETVALCGQEIKAVKEFVLENQIMYWSEESSNQELEEADMLDRLEIPIVYFYGKAKETIEMMQGVSQLLYDRDYWCIQLAEFEYSYLYGFETLPKGNTQERAKKLYEVAANKEIDLLLVGVETIDFSVEEDLIIKVSNYSEEDIGKLYTLITEYYK